MADEPTSGPYSPPDVSRDLIPTVIDHLAEEKPSELFITYSTGSALKAVTWKQYANAIDATARWVEEQVGNGHTTGRKCLAYFGSGGGDVGYAVVMIAAVKAGHYV